MSTKTVNSRLDRADRVVLAALLLAGILLYSWNLGNQYLWQDEAQTALISKTVLSDGVPRGFDGKNYFSQEEGVEYGENYIWKWHTWLPFYIVAGFFRLFGISTLAARLPFALFGAGVIPLLYLLCRRIWKDRKVALVAGFLLFTSVPFILLARQCRYYSMAAFFSVLGLYAYLNALENRKYADILFVLAGTLLFHTQYIYCATLLGAVVLHAGIFEREQWKRVFGLSALTAAINAPWIIWLAGMRYADQYGTILFRADKLWKLSHDYFLFFFRYAFSPYLLLILPVVYGYQYVRGRRRTELGEGGSGIALLLIFILLNYVAMVLASPWPHFRYLAPVVPAGIVLAAFLIALTFRVHAILPLLILAGMLGTGHIRNYFYEIRHDYDGPVEGIVRYLKEHSRPDDVVLITYGDLPLKFYTGLRVLGGLTGEDLSEAAQAEWVIVRKHLGSPYVLRVRKFIQGLNAADYEQITIDYPDIKWENREDLALHSFRTVEDESRVVIYRRRGQAGGETARRSR